MSVTPSGAQNSYESFRQHRGQSADACQKSRSSGMQQGYKALTENERAGQNRRHTQGCVSAGCAPGHE